MVLKSRIWLDWQMQCRSYTRWFVSIEQKLGEIKCYFFSLKKKVIGEQYSCYLITSQMAQLGGNGKLEHIQKRLILNLTYLQSL